MFSHVMLGARDMVQMVAFYDGVLLPLGLQREQDLEKDDLAGVIWRRGIPRWPQFAVRQPINGPPATWGNGVQISFAAPSRSAVDEAWLAATKNGGESEGRPGLRPQYADDFFAAYCRDPEGNKLCFVHAAELHLTPPACVLAQQIAPSNIAMDPARFVEPLARFCIFPKRPERIDEAITSIPDRDVVKIRSQRRRRRAHAQSAKPRKSKAVVSTDTKNVELANAVAETSTSK